MPDPDRPLESSPTSRPSSADHSSANMSPPIPVMCGSTTFSTAAAATAASTAFPPRSMTESAAQLASGWLVAAALLGASTVDRPVTAAQSGLSVDASSLPEARFGWRKRACRAKLAVRG